MRKGLGWAHPAPPSLTVNLEATNALLYLICNHYIGEVLHRVIRLHTTEYRSHKCESPIGLPILMLTPRMREGTVCVCATRHKVLSVGEPDRVIEPSKGREAWTRLAEGQR